jgi:hypothetical protein
MNPEPHAQNKSPNSRSDRRERGPSRRFTPHGHALGTTGHPQGGPCLCRCYFRPLEAGVYGSSRCGARDPARTGRKDLAFHGTRVQRRC